MFSNVRSVLSQCNTRFRLLHLLYDIALHAQNNKTRFFYVLYSDKTWVFDQSERAQGPMYIINSDKTSKKRVLLFCACKSLYHKANEEA